MPRPAVAAGSPPGAPSDVAPDLRPLSEAEIREQCDPASFGRGEGYARGGYLYDTFRRGNVLHARCHGSSGGPYRVEATLATVDRPHSPNPIAVACDCPRGDFCKHIVAMLLEWVRSPENFEPRPSIAESLANRSREELIGLIELMLLEEPDLEPLLALPVGASGTAPAGEVDEPALRRQIATIMRDQDGYDHRGRYDDYHAGSRIGSKLGRIVATGVAYATAGSIRNAVKVLATIVEETTSVLGKTRDDDGELGYVFRQCDEALAACLDAEADAGARLDATERQRLIDALYAIWHADLDCGGRDLSVEGAEAIARNATPAEQSRLAARLRESIAPAAADAWEMSWRNRAAIDFLSMLSGDAGLTDDELIDEYLKAQLWDDAAAAMVAAGRVDEAVALAARRLGSAIALTRFADQLVASGDPRAEERAVELVDSRLWEREGTQAHDDLHLLEWLQARYTARGQAKQALEMAIRRFKKMPSKVNFDAVKSAALLPDQPETAWGALRPELIQALTKAGNWSDLIEVQLEANDVGAALDAFRQSAATRAGTLGWYGFGYDDVRVRLAHAAERDFPDEAINLYRDLASGEIEARQRDHYREAAGYLARVKQVMAARGQEDAWRALITDVRQQHKSLRALREELDALGLN